jgi:hypothetical protein
VHAELQPLWWRAEHVDPVFAADELKSWPAGLRDRLVALGLLRETEPATSVMCSSCAHPHPAAVFYPNEDHFGRTQPHIMCPEDGLLAVDFDDLRQWLVDRPVLARALAQSLELTGYLEQLVSDRVWALGRRHMAGRFREFFLLCGANCRDAGMLLPGVQRILDTNAPVVFVPDALPRGQEWVTAGITVLRLAQIAWLGSGKLAVDTAFIEDVLCKDAPRPAAARTAVFPTPAGATWPEVRIVIGELSLKAEVRAVRREHDFKQLGFANNRRGGSVPNAKWEFLRLLARYGGVLSFDESRLTRAQRNNLKNYVKDARAWLQAFFGLDEEDPVPARKELRRYECRFQLAPEEGVRFPTPAGATWDQVSIRETPQGTIRISVDAVQVRSAASYGSGGLRKTEAALEAGSIERDYDLPFLQLADHAGRPTPAGRRLLDVLRGSGKVTASKDDNTMLELSQFLCALMQIGDAPFRFSYGTSVWTARFEASGSSSGAIILG